MVYGPDEETSEDRHRGEERSESYQSSYTIEVPFNSNASRSHDSERLEVEEEEDRRMRYRMSSVDSVSDRELWMELNHGGEEPDGEPDGDGPDFEPGPFTAMVQRVSREAARVGEPRPGGRRDPVTYPPIQQDEMQGAYPGAGVDMTPYSTYEKVTRMIECYNARLVECEYNNNPERYEEILREIHRLEELQVLADDVRPSEMANLPAGV